MATWHHDYSHWHPCTLAPLLWHRGAMVTATHGSSRLPGCQGDRVTHCHSATMPWCHKHSMATLAGRHGARVPGCRSAMVLWCQDIKVPAMVPQCQQGIKVPLWRSVAAVATMSRMTSLAMTHLTATPCLWPVNCANNSHPLFVRLQRPLQSCAILQ